MAIIAGEQKYTNIPVSILAIYAIPHDRGPTVNKDTAARAALEAFQKRHLYGVTDHILAEFSCGSHIMGDAFTSSAAPSFRVKLTGTAPFAKVHVIKDNQYVYSTSPGKAAVNFTWRDSSPAAGKTSYYYVRGEQQDGEIVWVSPM